MWRFLPPSLANHAERRQRLSDRSVVALRTPRVEPRDLVLLHFGIDDQNAAFADGQRAFLGFLVGVDPDHGERQQETAEGEDTPQAAADRRG